MSDSPRPLFLTGGEIEEFAAAYLVDSPTATTVDLGKALRAADTGRPVHNHMLVEVCDRLGVIPRLAMVIDAEEFLADMAARYEWVSVFWDRGWGDSGQVAEITVIQDGDGQLPLARVTAEVYRELLEAGTIAANSLQTFKARRVHDYVASASGTTECGHAPDMLCVDCASDEQVAAAIGPHGASS